jgi:predicted RNase H-like nuclease (RuvC/YqgF family)
MTNPALWLIIALTVYLGFRWFTLNELNKSVKNIEQTLAILQQEFSESQEDFGQMRKTVSVLGSTMFGVRRKLGFDNEWAEGRQIEQQIEMLQAELAEREKSSVK